jgi:lycopene beta-cyclase
MQTFDYIIAGAGAAGLSLAHKIINSPLNTAEILIVDRDAKRSNDRTWCFWINHEMPIDKFVSHQWDRLKFIGENFEKTYTLEPYKYKMVRGIDYYSTIRADLEKYPNVTWLLGTVEDIIDEDGKAAIQIDGKTYYGKWIFDSTFNPTHFKPDPTRYHNLAQHFVGWEIKTTQDCFDPSTVILFDFRTPQIDAMRFMYTLPFSPRSALVEYTLFSANLLDDGRI